MPRKNSVRRACAVSAAAVLAGVVPIGIAGQAGAATSTPTITASASAYILSAKHNATETIKAHVVDPKGVGRVEAQWAYPGTTHPLTGAFTLTSGTTAEGIWTATIPTFTCNPVWTITVVEYEGTSELASARTSLSVLIASDLPDTTAPGAFSPGHEPQPAFIGKPALPVNGNATVTAAPGAGVEFWTRLVDSPGCGQVASGTKSVTITAAPQSNPAATVTAQLHLAIDLTNPSTFGLHWAGTLELPAEAAPGPWTATAVASDYAGNVGGVAVLGNLVVSP